MERTTSFERSVPVAYAAAARILRTQAETLVCDDPHARTLELHAEVGGFEVTREVTVHFGEVRELDANAVAVRITWQATEHPGRFPSFDGLLELSALSHRPVLSQLALLGRVRPPFGPLGGVGEAVGGASVGDATLAALVDRVAERLGELVALDAAVLTETSAAAALTHPRVLLQDD